MIKFKDILNEIFVGPRKYKTYMPEEWNYQLLVRLFDEHFGFDLTDKSTVIIPDDVQAILTHFGATHSQSRDYNRKRILPKLIKILSDNGHKIDYNQTMY